jgi:hypothetical protein
MVQLPGRVVAGAVAALGAGACVFLLVVAAGQGVAQASLWAGVLAAVAGIAATVLTIWPMAARQSAKAAPRVVITSPTGKKPVPRRATARGLAQRIPDDITLWLVVRASDGFYPQRKIQPLADGTGTWGEPVTFGRVDGSVGHEYVLYVVGADPMANSLLELYRQQVAAGKTSPLSDTRGTYPDVTPYAAVNVIRGL